MPALSLSSTYAVAPSAPSTPYSESCFGLAYSPRPMSAARASALAACASPRALGPDVPLLLSEQRNESLRLAPPATMEAGRVNPERRTRNATAGIAALASASAEAISLAAIAAEKAGQLAPGQLPRNCSSFGADSKFGFDHCGSEAVFGMDGDDMDFD